MTNLSKHGLAILQVGVCYIIIATAQALWKLGIVKMQVEPTFSFSFIARYVGSWQFIAGSGLYVIATALWIYILSRYEFNLVYPMNSIGYIFAVLLSLWVFQESIPWNRFVGIGIIIVGVIVLSLK